MNLTFESNFEKLTCEFSCQPWNSILRYTSWIFWGIHKNLKMNITAIRPHLVFHGFVRVFVLLAAEAKKVENKRKIYIINLEATCSGCEWWWAFMTLNVKLAHPLLEDWVIKLSRRLCGRGMHRIMQICYIQTWLKILSCDGNMQQWRNATCSDKNLRMLGLKEFTFTYLCYFNDTTAQRHMQSEFVKSKTVNMMSCTKWQERVAGANVKEKYQYMMMMMC